jgi:hypothetical protein
MLKKSQIATLIALRAVTSMQTKWVLSLWMTMTMTMMCLCRLQ